MRLRGLLTRKRGQKKKLWKCRACGQRKTAMALEYKGNEGLCRACFDGYLPLALRAGKRRKAK